MSMFCNQCQETAKGIACTIKGVCGKEDFLANEMDRLIGLCYEVSTLSTLLRNQSVKVEQKVNHFIIDALFSTITNANFDKSAIDRRVEKGKALVSELKSQVKGDLPTNHQFEKLIGDEDVISLKQTVLYGLKGMSAYAEHAQTLGQNDEAINAFMQRALSEISRIDIEASTLINLVIETGQFGVTTMALLDKANTSAYGNPEITKVNIGVRDNPAILVSGHDLKDLEELLEQTVGTGVDVYTHSEMLPAHYYPAFKKYSHFVGNYGNAWWQQREEFKTFNGPILFTTNCIVPPTDDSIRERIYTTGSSGLVGSKHIPDRENGKMKDFSIIIEHAKRLPAPQEIETGEIIGGFAHEQVFALADKVVGAIKSGDVKKFVVMAGCDGRMKSREYYTDFAKALPQDSIILTAGCAKYRYNKLGLGDIDGIPRVLDAGQCNDSYSLVLIALKLKEIFGLDDINKLPIVYNIAWYEQKAVIVLLALLSLGVKNIHLGPTLPGFFSPNVANILTETFGIGSISSVEEDLKWLN